MVHVSKSRWVLGGSIIVLLLLANASAFAPLAQELGGGGGHCSVIHAFLDDDEKAPSRPAGQRPQAYAPDDYDCTGAVFAADGVEFESFPQPHNFAASYAPLRAGAANAAGSGPLAPYVPPFTHFVLVYKENHVFDDYLGDCKAFNASCDGVNQSTNHVSSVPHLHTLANDYALFDEYSTGTQPPSGPNHWWMFTAQSSTSNQKQDYPPTGSHFDRLLNHTTNGTTLLVNGDIYWMTNTNNGFVYNGSIGRPDWLPVSRPGTGIPEELNYNNYTLHTQNDDDTLIRSSFEDFVNQSGLPAYTYIELFNDHPGTYQDIPKNDAVTFDITNFLINDPRYHDNTVIVIAEDDTQNGANGPDHVSNTYRVPMIVVASEKYEKRHYISHVAYNTTNVIALMERVMNNVAPGIISSDGSIGGSTFPMLAADQSALGDPLSDIWLNSTQPPRLTSSASGSPTSGNVPLPVTFTGGATGGVPPYAWSWTFGDGGTSSAQSPNHTYGTAGNYTAALTVTDGAAQKSTSNVTITAAKAGSALASSASASPTSGQVPLLVAFTGTASGGTTPYNWTWTFGDGSAPSYQQDPNHTYYAPATYAANLTVRDSKGATNVSSVTISAAPSGGTSPSPQASASPSSGTAPLAVQFNASAVGGIPPYTWHWSFGDGGTSTAQNPSHTYTSAGTFAATVTATDSGATSGNTSVTINVSASGYALSQSFDANTSIPTGWTATGLWRVGANCLGAASAPNSLQYDRSSSCDYNTGSTTSGIATSPKFDILAAAAPTLSFKTKYHVESYVGHSDLMKVEAKSATGSWTTLWSRDSTNASQATWATVTLSLASFKSTGTQVRFNFNSVDGFLNSYPGWGIDDVTVSRGTAPLPSGAHVRINEMESNPSGTDTGVEYAELYNDGDATQDLTGWTLTANGGTPTTLALSGTLAAGAFLVVTSPTQWLDNTGESLTLKDATGTTKDATPTLDDTANDANSWQRSAANPNSWVFETSTRGAQNG